MENETLKLFIKISKGRMYTHYLPKFLQSIQSLKTDNLWSKETESLNTIGGIVLHICEHIKRNSIRYSIQNHEGFDKGIEDYFPILNLSPEELSKVVQDSFDEFDSVMAKLIENPPNVFDMHSLYHLVEHTGYHLGQVVDRSKRITNSSFNFCQNGINEKALKTIIKEF